MKKILLSAALALLLPIAACAPTQDAGQNTGSQTEASQPLEVGAIPDQDPEKLQRLYGELAKYLESELGVPVEYKPVTDYAAAVTAFKVEDLDLVWFGGLTGVQARLQVPGAEAIAQRDIDADFHSVFIANKNSGIAPINDVNGLQSLKGRSFTFGSESSTSGRLMPQYFLEQANVKLEDFKGAAGFSQSHDATLKLVEAGTYDAGVMNEQVWKSRLAAGEVDVDKVQVIWRTPAYYDYHWVVNPEVEKRYGDDFIERLQAALLKLDPNVPEQKEILELFGAGKFISTQNSNYSQIEEIGRQIGKIQ
ncbi:MULTISPECIES: putative selenate ABC transporter substrate-binding protein [unclassified Leptolyngbya]|uniref:putative selenate ABC transporter substrate-binding protein n=1 Tax=unclassified Leptolyngbya TaxID=2650499 RepID=UPI0016880CCE|nr:MULTISPECIES: putative selenate ABC transporter substrate-binding protein [unclassified Leptolyngbya]MBD1910597.1 putative selenate ABC transporter substrate-binding protein [Leptolyngbya sp. FACHB-8]MBD2154537.1 putative selenate ABC transporter substrate-binding protein [Leptolyngbya sp. FACHB-16]